MSPFRGGGSGGSSNGGGGAEGSNGLLFKSCSTSHLVADDDDTQSTSSACTISEIPDHSRESSYVPLKAVSCDHINTLSGGGTGSAGGGAGGGNGRRVGHFPYAYVRSKLSVLPEENGGIGPTTPGSRAPIFSTERGLRMRANSEEHVPAARVSYEEGCSTLGRLREQRRSFPCSVATTYSCEKAAGGGVSSNESGYDSDGPRGGGATESSDSGSLHEEKTGAVPPPIPARAPVSEEQRALWIKRGLWARSSSASVLAENPEEDKHSITR